MDKLIVDAGGGGHFRTVQEAINAAPDHSENRTVIYIRKGIYREKLIVPQTKRNLTLLGECLQETVLVYGDYARMKDAEGQEIGTFKSCSMYIYADQFHGENLTISNDAGCGDIVGQAIALHSEGDKAVFRRIRLLGRQDTLYTPGNGRQYFVDSYIEGTVDFIFGSATVVFERCDIRSITRTGDELNGLNPKTGYITASNAPEGQTYGYVFLNCSLTGSAPEHSVFLGRPWRAYAHVLFLRCGMEKHIHPDGWNNWRDSAREQTARYGEYGSNGPGSDPESRVRWSRQLNKAEADAITVQTVLIGTDSWDPDGGISILIM